MPPRSAPAASSPTTRPRFRSITAAPGSATPIRSARSWPAAARSGCRWSRGPTRTRCATRCGRRIRTGSPSTRTDEPRRHWANPDLWVTCALGPYNFEFMDQVHREIVAAVQSRRHFLEPVGAAGRRLLLRALPGELPARDRPRPAAHGRSPRSRAARVHRVAQGPTDGVVEALGRHACGRRIPTPASFPTVRPTSRRPASSRRSSSPTIRRGAGMMPPWANGRRAKEFRSVMGRRPIGGIFSVGLEEPYRWKDSVQSDARSSALGGRRHGQRHAALGDEVLRRALRSSMAAGRWSASTTGTSATSAIFATRSSLARVALLHSEQTAAYHAGVAQGDRHEDHMLGMYHALVESRVPFELVHEAFLTPERLEVVQTADPRRHRRAVGRAMRRDSRLCEEGGSLLATFASSLLRRSGPPAPRLRSRRRVRRVVSPAASMVRCRIPT